MAVYVDNMRAPLGRMILCHMVADSTPELMEMAQRIGMDKKWLQNAGTPKEHFDICLKMRALAVMYGAKEVTTVEMVEKIRGRR